MKITIEETQHIASLSRLEFNTDELGRIRDQLDSIINFIDKLNELDTSAVQPTSHILNISNVTRQDTLAHSMEVHESLKNAPDAQGMFFRVPKIIE